MPGILTGSKKTDVAKAVDEIENTVYTELKPLGFRKFGRTLHRFVSEDVSQVINFQSGMPQHGMNGLMCVNIGIRIPECAERTFSPEISKKYYHEYECTIRSRLGTVSGKRETWYNLAKSTKRTAAKIISEIRSTVLPAFDILCDRQAILQRRKDYPAFDTMNPDIAIDEAMIYGHLGDMEKAKAQFAEYYQKAVDEYQDALTNGTKNYLKKGERIVYMGQDIAAEKNGYVTICGASHGHIDYLDELAIRLGLR